MDKGILGLIGRDPLSAVTANPNMMNQGILARNKAPFQMKPNTPQGLLDGAALATSPVPILGDLIGLGADGYRFATDPSSRTPANFGLTALGALPFVPPASAIFAGALAKTAKLDKKALAEGMEAAGRSRDDIWKETGWFKGPEGRWKFEIDDSGAAVKKAGIDRVFDYGGSKQKTFMPHENLHSAYPDTGDIWTRYSFNDDGLNQYGKYSGLYNENKGAREEIALNIPRKKTDLETTKSINLHELQHAVQKREGFAGGGNPDEFSGRMNEYYQAKSAFDSAFETMGNPAADAIAKSNAAQIVNFYGPKLGEMRKYQDPVSAYRSLAGEAEARAVQSRMNMNQAQRQATPPWQSYDIPWEQLITR